jgi:hypothetical protein
MGYWRQVGRQAWKRTAGAVGRTPLRVAAWLLAQIAGAAVVWLALGRLGVPPGEVRLVASAVPFLAWPLLHLWHLIGAPAALHRELRAAGEARQSADAARIAALEAEIARLRAEPLPPSRDPDAIFQNGVQVGRAILGLADPATGSASFQQIAEAADFDTSAEFDYRDWVLKLEGVGGDARSQIGGMRQRTLSRVVCRIDRRRAWRQST